MPPTDAAAASSFGRRSLLALAFAAASGVLAPVFGVIATVMLEKLIAAPDAVWLWTSILLAGGSAGSGCIAVAAARSRLRVGWAEAGRVMRGPFGLASVVFVGLYLLTLNRFRQPGVFEESSPYLATSVMALGVFAEGAVGALVLSLALATRSSRAPRPSS